MNQTAAAPSPIVRIFSIAQQSLVIVMVALLCIGVVMNFVTLLIFRGAKHRKNACSIFCAATSAANILILTQGIVGNFLAMVLPTDPENYNLGYCKTRL